MKANDYKYFVEVLKKGNYYIECSCGCGATHSARSLNFVFDKVGKDDTEAKEALNDWKAALSSDEEKLQRKQRDQSTKTKTVLFGQKIEPLVPHIDGFKYGQKDCRYFNNPIDLIIFDGLHATGNINEIIISEIKSFDATLNPAQRWIREAVQDKKVRYLEY